MNVTRKIKLLIVITTNLLFVSCIPNKEYLDLIISENNKTVDNFNAITSKSAIKDSNVVEKIAIEDKHDRQNIIKDKDLINPSASKLLDFSNVTESKNTTSLKPKVKKR